MDRSVRSSKHKMTVRSLAGLIDNLSSAVQRLTWSPADSVWADYYHDTSYSSESFVEKKRHVSEFLDIVRPQSVWDIGANVGLFSRIVAKRNVHTVAFDIDPAAAEKNYLKVKKDKFEKILDEYYEARKFDVKTGLPTRHGLEDLGLKDMADDLAAMGKLGSEV